jgi:hypothetical protein
MRGQRQAAGRRGASARTRGSGRNPPKGHSAEPAARSGRPRRPGPRRRSPTRTILRSDSDGVKSPWRAALRRPLALGLLAPWWREVGYGARIRRCRLRRGHADIPGSPSRTARRRPGPWRCVGCGAPLPWPSRGTFKGEPDSWQSRAAGGEEERIEALGQRREPQYQQDRGSERGVPARDSQPPAPPSCEGVTARPRSPPRPPHRQGPGRSARLPGMSASESAPTYPRPVSNLSPPRG